MESRFGPLGRGTRRLVIGGHAYALRDVLARLGLGFDGCRTIDGFELAPAHFAVRYYDPDEQRIVAFEFDAEFRYRAEMRVHVAEWLGLEVLATGALTADGPPPPGGWGGDGGAGGSKRTSS